MNPATVTRFARQLALPEVGPAGQERLGAARAAIVGDALAAEIVARYLAAAGVGALRLIGGGAAARGWEAALRGSNPDVAVEHVERPADGPGWMAALDGAAIVVRADFGDDAMLPAAIRRGVPAVIMRGAEAVADVVSFRKHGPCPHAPLDIAAALAVPFPDDAASVVAGTLAASEALHVLLGDAAPARGSRAWHLRVPLDGGDATAHEIPWTPECFACGGSGAEMSFA
jgi:hypothetical protein